MTILIPHSHSQPSDSVYTNTYRATGARYFANSFLITSLLASSTK